MCDMSHSYAWQDLFICVTQLNHVFVCHDSSIGVTWLIHMCASRLTNANATTLSYHDTRLDSTVSRDSSRHTRLATTLSSSYHETRLDSVVCHDRVVARRLWQSRGETTMWVVARRVWRVSPRLCRITRLVILVSPRLCRGILAIRQSRGETLVIQQSRGSRLVSPWLEPRLSEWMKRGDSSRLCLLSYDETVSVVSRDSSHLFVFSERLGQ